MLYRDSFCRIAKLLGDPGCVLPREHLETLFKALERRVVPVAARRLYQKQHEVVARYEAVLLGLLSDFEDDLESAIAESPDLEERKRAARERVNALGYWMTLAAWEWFYFGFAMGKLSVHLSPGDILTTAYAWQRNEYYVFTRLTPDLAAALVAALEEGEAVAPTIEKFRWRVKMYAGALWGISQLAAIYRPPPEERMQAKEPWVPPVSWWTFPIMDIVPFPLMWEAPPEWGVPDEPADDVPAFEIAQKQTLWTGSLDEATCLGERGCWPKIGKIWPVATLEINHWFPTQMNCLSNCRCGLTPLDAAGNVPRGAEAYQWPFV